MDIEKEREAFEHHKFKDQYDELKAYYDEHEREFGYRYPSYNYDDEWEVWLAAKAQSEKALLEQFEINNKLVEQIEKLKARAVPDGFVVVPKEPTQELLNKMQDYFVGAFENGLTGGQSIHCAYKAMIEVAQESTND